MSVTSIKFWSYELLMLKFFVISAVISYKHENIQQTSSLFFSIMNALLKMSCKEYIHYKWLINRVKEELSIDESKYMQLKTRIWNQMRSLQLIKRKLNINKSKEIRLIASSRVFKFELSTQLEKCWVELNFFWKSVESSWEVKLKHSSRVEKLDSITQLENSTQLDKILNRCK